MAALLAGCANPMPPGGGPPDDTPPRVAESDPEPEAVNVSTDRDHIRFVFADYIEERSFENAFSITPPVDGPIQFDWRGRRVDVQLPHSLQENVTYVITLDTDLRTWRDGQLSDPITLAFSTGDEIAGGRLAGEVVQAQNGQPASGYDIFAYAAPDSTPPNPLPERPVHRTQTDNDGNFELSHLADIPYYVIAVDDENRNRRPDPLEAFAPPPEPVFRADSVDYDTGATWIVAQQDTVPPEFLRVQPRSNSRLWLRFSEPVHPGTANLQEWNIQHTETGEQVEVTSAYQEPETPSALVLRTDPMQPETYELNAPEGGAVDSTGTPNRPFSAEFSPPAERDTVLTRFRHFLREDRIPNPNAPHILYPGERPGFRLSQPIDTQRLRQLLTVTDALDQERAYEIDEDRAPTYRLDLEPPASARSPVTVQFDARQLEAARDTTFQRIFQRLPRDEVGELRGIVRRSDPTLAPLVISQLEDAAIQSDTLENGTIQPEHLQQDEAPIVVELIPVDVDRALRRTTVANPDGSFLFDQLPEGNYRFRAFEDRDGTGTWNPGSVAPYQPPEAIAWSPEPLRVRARWETTAGDILHLYP